MLLGVQSYLFIYLYNSYLMMLCEQRRQFYVD